MAITLKLDRAEYNLGDTIRASITVTNKTAQAASLPKPEFGLNSVSVRLIRAGSQSILARVGAPTASESVAPGQSLSGVIEFPAVEAGALQIEALYNPGQRSDPTFVNAKCETSNRVAFKVAGGKKLQVKLTTDAGPIVLEFFPDRAHNHVLSFVQLAAKGYYNKILFHRIVPEFVIQGGDPTGTGSGGPGYKLPAEFNDIPHDDGILSMARTSDPHSAGSQFFLCLSRERTAGLDNQYTVFGKVVSGLDAVHKIGASESNAGRFRMQKAEVVLA